MKVDLSVFFFLFGICACYAQNHDNTWLMGGTCSSSLNHRIAKLDFNNKSFMPDTLPEIAILLNPTNASISDAYGDLQFFTNGNDIFNWKYEKIKNGSNLANLGECGDQRLAQGAIAIPYPEHQNQYVLLTINEEFIQHEEDIQVIERVYFNVVDMNANIGEGELVVRQDLIVEDTLNIGQGMVCQHANGRDWWLTLFEYDTNRYYSYLIGPNGVELMSKNKSSFPVLSGRNQASYSSNGELLAYFNAISSVVGTYIDIFNFDRCTGTLSEQRKILIEDNISFGGGGVAFSPNSRFLYVPLELNVYQYDLWADDLEASRVTVAVYDGFIEDNFWTSTFHLAQLAPDDKIYITTPTDGHYLHIIHNPNEKGLACNLEQHALHWPTWKHISISNFPHYRMGALEGSLCDTIGIASAPLADFGIENLGPDFSYFFDDLSTSNTSDWQWDFGDGNSSSEQSPMHTYNQYGSYNICLTVSNEAGSNTQCQNLCVLPDASNTSFISAYSTELDCSDSQSTVTLSTRLEELNFYEASSWIARWEGPDDFLVENSSAIEVSQQGTYILTLMDGNNACLLSDSISISKNNANIVFDLNPSLAILPCGGSVDVVLDIEGGGCYVVQSTDEFGNQIIGTDTTVFNFTSAGNYVFKVTDCEGGCETIQELSVELDTITALWEADILENTVAFRPLEEDEILQHIWEFGDGAISFEVEPTHTYNTTGTYEVEHTAFSFCENRSYKSVIEIVGGVFSAPSANFIYSNEDSLLGFVFEDQTVNVPSDWLWEFGDGALSTEQNPSHVYSKYGSYEVCLTASNSIGSDTYCETLCVLPDELQMDFLQASDTVLNCKNIEQGIRLSTSIVLAEFYNSEDWFITWTSPSGETSEMEELLLFESGNYVYKLMDTTSACSIRANIEIVDNFDTPNFSITTSADTIPCGESFELLLTISDSICFEAIVYQNELPILSTTHETIILEGSGEYSVELIHCSSGCSSAQEFTIENAEITAAWTAEEMGATIVFNSTQANSVEHAWDFGDGSNSSEVNPTHTYASSGTYEVTHIVSNDCAADTLIRTVEIVISSSYSLAKSGLEVFPNPTSDVLNIYSEEREMASLSLYSSIGQKVVDEKPHAKAMRFSADGFAPGVYWLHVVLIDGGEYWTKILVIE